MLEGEGKAVVADEAPSAHLPGRLEAGADGGEEHLRRVLAAQGVALPRRPSDDAEELAGGRCRGCPAPDDLGADAAAGPDVDRHQEGW